MHITLSNDAGVNFEPSALSIEQLEKGLAKMLGIKVSADKPPWIECCEEFAQKTAMISDTMLKEVQRLEMEVRHCF